MKTFFIKTQYLYDEEVFFLYEPFQVPKDAKVDKDNKGKIRFIKNGNETITTHVLLTEIVETFKPDANNMLADDYKPRFVSAIYSLGCNNMKTEYHKRCEVLKDKRGSYTMLKCCDCGRESPIAINSFILISKFDSDLFRYCEF